MSKPPTHAEVLQFLASVADAGGEYVSYEATPGNPRCKRCGFPCPPWTYQCARADDCDRRVYQQRLYEQVIRERFPTPWI